LEEKSNFKFQFNFNRILRSAGADSLLPEKDNKAQDAIGAPYLCDLTGISSVSSVAEMEISEVYNEW
jgi:hypothetical protein